jgi:transcriptional regulator GlxA family with amidase domain
MRCGLSARLPDVCTVLHITPLLRELIIETVRLERLRMRNRLHCALRDLVLSQLETASPIRISLTLPHDRRARVVADCVMRNLGERQSLAAMCVELSASVLTIQRIFRREVGSDFESWRRQVRLMRAIELLVSGRSVKEVSFAVGYRQPTAFVATFREFWVRHLEHGPGQCNFGSERYTATSARVLRRGSPSAS